MHQLKLLGWGLSSAVMIAVSVTGCSPDRQQQSYTAGGDSGHAPIRNGMSGAGAPVDTGLVVTSGDQMTIQPLSIVREERMPVPPAVTRLNSNVCVQNVDVCSATVPVIQRQCHNSCKLCQKCLVDFMGLGCSESLCCVQQCQDVHTGDQCVAWSKQCVKQENQWTETSRFSGLGGPKATQDHAPMKSAAALLTGLKLRFSYSDDDGQPKQADCPLAAFKPEVSAEKFVFQLRDVPGCPALFSDQPGTPRMLEIINGMIESVAYSEGLLVKTWDGRTLEEPRVGSYHPLIDLSLTVSVQAGSLSQGESHRDSPRP